MDLDFEKKYPDVARDYRIQLLYDVIIAGPSPKAGRDAKRVVHRRIPINKRKGVV